MYRLRTYSWDLFGCVCIRPQATMALASYPPCPNPILQFLPFFLVLR